MDETEGASSKLDFDLIPSFQRVSVSGEDTSGVRGDTDLKPDETLDYTIKRIIICSLGPQVPYEDLVHASKFLVNALRLRESYMAKSRQSFPNITSRFLSAVDNASDEPPKEIHHDDKKTIDGTPLINHICSSSVYA